MKYHYDRTSGVWIAEVPSALSKYDEAGHYVDIQTDAAWREACTLTRSAVEAMGIDRNTNTDPAEYKIYDMMSPPGTPGRN